MQKQGSVSTQFLFWYLSGVIAIQLIQVKVMNVSLREMEQSAFSVVFTYEVNNTWSSKQRSGGILPIKYHTAEVQVNGSSFFFYYALGVIK